MIIQKHKPDSNDLHCVVYILHKSWDKENICFVYFRWINPLKTIQKVGEKTTRSFD